MIVFENYVRYFYASARESPEKNMKMLFFHLKISFRSQDIQFFCNISILLLYNNQIGVWNWLLVHIFLYNFLIKIFPM